MSGPFRQANPSVLRVRPAVSFSSARLLWLPLLRVLLALLVLGSTAGFLHAESTAPRRYVIDVWHAGKGLPQNTVSGIAQTSDGYLWLTTLDGVARFDGVRFKMFKAADTPALGSGRIRFLFAGRRGELWLSTQEGGFIRLENGRFTPLWPTDTRGARPAVTQVAEDESGGLWLSTEDGRVSRLGVGRLAVVSTNWGAADNAVFEVRADVQGRLWALSNSVLYAVSGEKLVPVEQGNASRYSVRCPGRAGGWWLGVGDQIRLWRDGRWVAAVGRPGVPAESITCALEDRGGHLWVGTAGSGLFRCATNGEVQAITMKDGLSGDSVRTLMEDGEGNLWAGMQDSGLSRLRLPLFAVYGPSQGLSSERTTTVSEGPEGDLWVGTDGYGLNRLRGETARPVSDESSGAMFRVASVLADKQGRVWTGLRNGGLFRCENGRFTAVGGHDFAGHSTRSLFEDSHGAVWIGQRYTKNLVRVEGDTVRTIELPQAMHVSDIRVTAEDAAGAMWFGTDGAGLLRWGEGRFTRFTRENGLSSDFVWALQPEPDGTLWIGTYGGGLTRLKDGHMVQCTTRHGLVDDVICCIADDGRGQYWFSSNQGIFRVDKGELNEFAEGKRNRIQCVAYGRSDGLPALECEGGCQPAGCRSRDGRLWFPTIRGLVVVDPANLGTNTVAPPVHIESLVVDGKVIDATEWQADAGEKAGGAASMASVPGGFGKAGTLEIAPGSRRFEFHYTGLNFSAPEQLRFRHKLEGVDAGWVDTGVQRDASYNRLAHGTYTFRVQACNREGVWNRAGDVLTFTVLPHFWQTGWFMVLFLAAFGGTVGSSVRLVLRRRHERQVRFLQHLHGLERERTRIARDIHDDLGGSLTEIGYMGALAVRDSQTLDGAREQLARITDRTREVARRLDETVWAVNPKNDTLAQLASYLCRSAREFLEATSIRCRLDVPAALPDVPLTAEVRHHLFLVVKEALNNAAKHSGASELWLRVEIDGGFLVIEVTDNGRGFQVDARREAGNGLRNMTARMEEIGGVLILRSVPGTGSTVCLRLALPAGEPGGKPTDTPPI